MSTYLLNSKIALSCKFLMAAGSCVASSAFSSIFVSAWEHGILNVIGYRVSPFSKFQGLHGCVDLVATLNVKYKGLDLCIDLLRELVDIGYGFSPSNLIHDREAAVNLFQDTFCCYCHHLQDKVGERGRRELGGFSYEKMISG